MMTTSKDAAKALLRRYKDNPVLFCYEVFGFEVWKRQAEAMDAVVEHDFVALRSGHKIGKSRLDAGLALWWSTTRKGGRSIFTAPSGHQVRDILWVEVVDLYETAAKRGKPLGGHLYDDYHKGLKLGNGREVFGLTTRDKESFAGLSGEVFFVVDEASGFPEPIFESVFGNMTGGGKVLLTGNPTKTNGTFHGAFHGKADAWKRLHVRSTESPNFHGGNIPHLAGPKFLEFARKQWGEGTPVWNVRIEGEFPDGADNQVIPLSFIDDAKFRYELVEAEGLLTAGIDPARYGPDNSKMAVRRGKKHLAQITLPPGDGPDTAHAAYKELSPFILAGEIPDVKVDEIGIGVGVVDAFRKYKDLKGKVNLIAVDARSNALDSEHYHRTRDQLWFAAREWLEEGGALLEHDDLEADLGAPTYLFDARGRFLVESKDSIKARLGRSPDDGDAFCLCVYDPKVHYTSLRQQSQHNKRIITLNTDRAFMKRVKRSLYRR